MRYLKVVVCLLLLSSLLVGQSRKKLETMKFFDENSGTPNPSSEVSKINNYSATNPPKASNITWTLIDKGRFLTVGQSNIHPLTYEPDLNILVHVHQGDYSHPDSGGYSPFLRAVYYSYSTNLGSTWTRMPDPVNFPDPQYTDPPTGGATAAWPNSAIWNPDNDINTTWWYGCWMGNNNPDASVGDYQDAMWDTDFPIFSNTPINNRQLGGVYHPGKGFRDSTWFYDNGPHCTFTSDAWMFDLYSTIDAVDFQSAVKYKRGIARYDGTGSIDYYIPAKWDTMAWASAGEQFGGDAITAPGGIKMVGACWVGFYNDYQVWDSIAPSNPNGVNNQTYRIAVSLSTNDGTTFGNWDTIPLSTLPGIGSRRTVHLYGNPPLAENRANGTFLFDSLGQPHVFVALKAEPLNIPSTDPAICELYKDAGVWKGKVIGPLNANAKTSYGSFEQFGCALSAARNKNGTAFFVSYGNCPSNQSGEADIYVAGRHISMKNWKGPFNVTNTPGVYETVNHLASIAPSVGINLYRMCLTYTTVPNETNGNVANASFWFGSYDLDATPVLFDYTFDALPTVAGRTCTPDTVFPVLKGTIRNSGENPQVTSFQVRYRILKGNTIVYQDSQITSGLGDQESRDLTFTGSWQPPDTGVYTIEGLIQANDQVAGNDIKYGTVHVIYPSPIAQSVVAKLYHPYQEIAGTAFGLHKDDTTGTAALPFAFKFDGVAYDSFTVSTNGWMEFGTADTTDSVLTLHRKFETAGGASNENLASTVDDLVGNESDCNKVLGAWWEDMATYGEFRGTSDSGDIYYTTQGTAPNRVFVVQWKNMAARFEDDNRGTRLNWQVRLSENSNMIEFSYGPIVAGQFTNAALNSTSVFGASIGMADTLRGPFHYFDIYKYLKTGYGYGDVNFLEGKLNPLDSWPGPDTSYRMAAGMKVITTQINPRWNLISNPVGGTQPVNSIFPTPNRNGATSTWGYSGSYVSTATLVPGKGYWAKFVNAPSPQVITGSPLLSVSIPLSPGWNLIGSVDHDVPAPSVGGIITGFTFGYTSSYAATSVIKPGKGYWVKSSGGVLNLGPVAAPKVAPENFDIYSSVTITDKNGSKQTLYLRENDEKVDMDRYEMPPALQGNFDARFASGRILEAYPADIKSGVKFPLSVQSSEYPLTVSWDVKNTSGKGFSLEINDGKGKVTAQHTMSGKGSVILSKGTGNNLAVAVGSGPAVPKEFALGQNYPNPFNPSTSFAVDVPKTAVVNVDVYDVLGRKVASLFNGEKAPGYYTVEWNGVNAQNQVVSSGIYFIRMTSDQFSAVRKVMMMK